MDLMSVLRTAFMLPNRELSGGEDSTLKKVFSLLTGFAGNRGNSRPVSDPTRAKGK